MTNAVSCTTSSVCSAPSDAKPPVHDRILAALPSVVIVFSADLRVNLWNHAAEMNLGAPAEAILGRALEDLPVGWNMAGVRSVLETCLSTRATAKCDALSFVRNDGHDGTLGATAIPLLDVSGEVEGILFFAADRTDRLAEERHLMQAQKLESIGQLAAGIAHEINTPTQYVSDNTRYLLRVFQKLETALNTYRELIDDTGLKDPRLIRGREEWITLKIESILKSAPQAIEEALEGLDRIATIVRAMKEFSHPGTEDKCATDINQCIASTVTVARNEWKYVAKVELDLDPALQAVPCLAGEFNQVILNMLVNAAHTIADRVGDTGELGLIKVTTRQRDHDVVVAIQDSGMGMTPEVRARIFDPFFTTKEVGKGTGQGLALAHDVIRRRHGGSIGVESEPGVGTTFSIVLPMSASETEVAA